jgi:hypothetical protein
VETVLLFSPILLKRRHKHNKKDEAFLIVEIRIAIHKKPKIVCSPSYVDIRSRANTTRGLDFEHMIKASAHKGGVRIGKTPKKLASICCP